MFIQENAFEKVVWKMAAICLGLNVLNTVNQKDTLIVVAKMCISKFVYGGYGNLVNLLENELKIRKIFQTW